MGRILTPQTSHEGSWCQASIAMPNQKLLRPPLWSPGQPSRSLLAQINSSPMRPSGVVGDALASSKRSGKSTGFCWPPIPPVVRERVFRSRLLHTVTYSAAALRSMARAHLLTAALMPAEPHIRSPFPERLAPQSLILKVIGLGRAGPHCISAYHSHCLRRSARPDPTRLIRPRGTRDNDFGFLECLSLPS